MGQQTPKVGEDVTALMGGASAPAVGADVTHLMSVTPPEPSMLSSAVGGVADAAKNVGVGALKGAGQTAVNLGRMVQMVPGVTKAVDALYGTPGISKNAMSEADKVLAPQGAAQKVGKLGEQVGEVLIPGSKIATLGEIAAAKAGPKLAPLVGQAAARMVPRAAVEAAGGAALATAQGGDPRVGAVGGAIGPIVGAAAEALPGKLKEQAVKKVVQALGPTKERYKAIAERLAPQMLQRGLGGSRKALQEKAAGMMETVGDQLDTALQQYGAKQVGTQPIVQALETAKDAFRTTAQTAAGQKVVEYEPRAIKQLDGLQKIITDLGDNASVDQLVAVRRAWDKVVDQAGGFAHRAGGAIGVPLKDQSEAWAKREATGAIRKVLDSEVPELTAINKEWSFWKNLDDVLSQTMKRTAGHGPGLGSEVKEAAGQAVGAIASGGSLGAALGVGKLAKMANAVFTSPRWKLVDARSRNALAEAIASNNASRIGMTLARIASVEGSKVPAAVSGQ